MFPTVHGVFRWFLRCLLSHSVCFAGSKASFDWLQGIYRMWLKVYFSGLKSRNTETLGKNNSLELFDTRPFPGCNCTVWQLLQEWWHLLTFGLLRLWVNVLYISWNICWVWIGDLSHIQILNCEGKRGSRIVEINQTSYEVFQINQQ